MGLVRFDVAVKSFAAVILTLALAGPTVAAPAAGAAETVLAALPVPGPAAPVPGGPITKIQTGTCGCENGKQKIWKTLGGQQVCVVTNLPCTAP